MEGHVRSIVDTLGYANIGPVPRGELFVSRQFLDHFFGEYKGSHPRQLAAAARTMGLSLVGIDLTAGPKPLLSHGGLASLEPFFAVGCINGPVERLIGVHGFAIAMTSLRRKKSLFSHVAADLLKEVEETAKAARGSALAAIAIADDIAGNRGLLFSPDHFVSEIGPAYRDMAQIIKGNGLFAFFHSDGDMRNVIGFLIEAGYQCIHPVDANGSMDVYDLRAEFGNSVSFMGHIDIMAWDAEAVRKECRRAEEEFAEGGLILGSMGGISMGAKPESLLALYPGLSSRCSTRRGR